MTIKETARRQAAKRMPPKPAKGKAPARKGKKAPLPSGSKTQALSPPGSIRVRMYRVGFGDFFLLTVPTTSGPQHILIDCGVHGGDIGTMADCVTDLVAVTNRKLALVILTHYHADHLSGFATQSDEFAKFQVGGVWITNRLDPNDKSSTAFMAQLTTLAGQLRLHLQLRLSLELEADARTAAEEALAKVDNALGFGFGIAAGINAKALALLRNGFANKPPVHYYQAGDRPELPESLKGAITAEILSPSPRDSQGEFAADDDKAEQYFEAASETGLPDTSPFKPFIRDWPASASDYPQQAFRPWRSPAEMEKALRALQPDALAAAASLVDGTLNNQSLVVLFTVKGRKLLFVGDAQWGNWSYWLYGKKVRGQAPAITDSASKILGSIDFYKVGHHGSTNANPIPAVSAMPKSFAAMCSTETGYPSKKRTHGSIERKTEVPRIPLIEALEKQSGNRLVRSDWIKAGKADASPEALSELPRLPPNFSTGDVYIDYIIPA